MKGHLLSEVPVSLCGLCNYKFSLIHPLAWIYEANTVVQLTQSPVSLNLYAACMPSGRRKAVPYRALIYLHKTSEVRRDMATIVHCCFFSYFMAYPAAELINS